MDNALANNSMGLETKTKCPIGSDGDEGRARRRDVDGGWAWVVLVASFVSTSIAYGHYFNGGIYFVAFLRVFGQSRSQTAWIYSAQAIGVHGLGPLSGIVLSRYGPRMSMMSASVLSSVCLAACYFAQSVIQLAILFGLIGFGLILSMTSSLAVMSIYFDRHFGLATGLTSSGAGVGFVALGLLMEWSIDAFGWRGSMLIQSGILLQMTICGALFFPIDTRAATTTKAGAKSRPTLTSVLRDVRFHAIVLSCFLFLLSLGVMLLVLKDSFLSNDFGDDVNYGAVLVGFGVASALGRFAGGLLPERLLNPLLQYFAYSAIASATSVAISYACVDPWPYVACVTVYGFCAGAHAVLQALSLAYIFGNEAMSILWGFTIATGAVSFVTGAPLVGYLVDVSGTYNGAFTLVSICILISGLLTLLCHLIHRRKLNPKTEKSIQEQESKPLSEKVPTNE